MEWVGSLLGHRTGGETTQRFTSSPHDLGQFKDNDSQPNGYTNYAKRCNENIEIIENVYSLFSELYLNPSITSSETTGL